MDLTAASRPAVQLYRYTALAHAFEDAIKEQGGALPLMFVDALRESFDRCVTAIMTSRVDARDAAVCVEGELQAYQHGDPTRWDFTVKDATVRFPGHGERTLVLEGLQVTSLDLALARPKSSSSDANGGAARKRTRGASRKAAKPAATAAAGAASVANEGGAAGKSARGGRKRSRKSR